MVVTLKVIGADVIAKKLLTASKEVKTQLNVAMQESGMILKEEIEGSIAGQRAEPRSVDTGAFLASISSVPIENGVLVASSVPHSLFLEYGTVYIDERRHFRNSLDRVKPVIKDITKESIKKLLK